MISIIEKTTKEVGGIFLKKIREDTTPIKMPYEYEDKKDLKIFINKYDNGDCCVTIITRDVESQYYFGHIIIKKGAIFITEKIEDVDSTLSNIPGINSYAILLSQSLIIHNEYIMSDKDFLSLLYILNEMVNYSVNDFKKTNKPQIMELVDFDYIVKNEVIARIKLNASANILRAFLPEDYIPNK